MQTRDTAEPNELQHELERVFLKHHEQYADVIYRLCVFKTSDPDKAADLTQDTFARFWDTLSRRGPVEKPKQYLYQIARNLIIDTYKARRVESLDALQDEGFEPSDGASQSAESQLEAQYAVSLIRSLDDAYREIVYMRLVEGFGPKEIAETLELSENVVSVRLHRGIAQLRAHLGSN